MTPMTASLRYRRATGHRWRPAEMLAGTVIAFALAAGPAQAATVNFSPTGTEQSFSVPADVTSVTVTAVGASGASGVSHDGPGGLGGHGAVVTGTVAVTPGQTLYVLVGDAASPAGFNGGGDRGGGGASDVRTVPIAEGSNISLQSRVVVAGGGGGGGDASNYPGSSIEGGLGGDAGSPGGGEGYRIFGGAGTASSGGPGAAYQIYGCGGTSGGFGYGGDGCGAGGGGGLYGGGGGGASAQTQRSGGGGGGSSLVPAGGYQGLAPRATPAGIYITYVTPSPPFQPSPPALAMPPPSSPDMVVFTSSPKSLSISKTGSFTYRLISAPGRAGKAKLTSTKKVKVGANRRTLKVSSKSFTAPANGEVKLKFKLSASNLKALMDTTSLQFKLSVTVGSTNFTAKLKLKPPKKS